MLTIRNYHKLCNKSVGGDGWKVLYCAENDKWYEIKMVCTGKTSSHIYLERKPTKTSTGRVAYMFRDGDGKLTSFGVTSDWIKNIRNMLKALNRFVC